MSVDKFGRYNREYDSDIKHKLAASVFAKTVDGDYDAQDKLMRNVKDPVLNKDAATKGYVLQNIIPQTSEGDYDLKTKRIKNLGNPVDFHDAASVGFVKDNALSISEVNNHYDAHNRCIKNVSLPLVSTDVATMQFVQGYTLGRTSDKNYTCKYKLLRDVQDPVLPADAANARFVEKRSLKRTRSGNNIDMEGKMIRNIGDPLLPGDVVNVGYVSKHTPSEFDDYWMFSEKRLSNVQDPIYDGEAVNLRTLHSLALTKNGGVKSSNYDAGGLKVVNIGNCTDEGDAVNFKTLSTHVRKWITRHEGQLERLSSAIFDYIHRQSGRSSQEGINNKNYLDWNKILGEEVNEEEDGFKIREKRI